MPSRNNSKLQRPVEAIDFLQDRIKELYQQLVDSGKASQLESYAHAYCGLLSTMGNSLAKHAEQGLSMCDDAGSIETCLEDLSKYMVSVSERGGKATTKSGEPDSEELSIEETREAFSGEWLKAAKEVSQRMHNKTAKEGEDLATSEAQLAHIMSFLQIVYFGLNYPKYMLKYFPHDTQFWKKDVGTILASKEFIKTRREIVDEMTKRMTKLKEGVCRKIGEAMRFETELNRQTPAPAGLLDPLFHLLLDAWGEPKVKIDDVGQDLQYALKHPDQATVIDYNRIDEDLLDLQLDVEDFEKRLVDKSAFRDALILVQEQGFDSLGAYLIEKFNNGSREDCRDDKCSCGRKKHQKPINNVQKQQELIDAIDQVTQTMEPTDEGLYLISRIEAKYSKAARDCRFAIKTIDNDLYNSNLKPHDREVIRVHAVTSNITPLLIAAVHEVDRLQDPTIRKYSACKVTRAQVVKHEQWINYMRLNGNWALDYVSYHVEQAGPLVLSEEVKQKVLAGERFTFGECERVCQRKDIAKGVKKTRKKTTAAAGTKAKQNNGEAAAETQQTNGAMRENSTAVVDEIGKQPAEAGDNEPEEQADEYNKTEDQAKPVNGKNKKKKKAGKKHK